MFRAIRSIGTRSRFGGGILLLALTAVACSAGPNLAATSPPSTAASLPSPARSSAAGTPVPSRSASPAAGGTWTWTYAATSVFLGGKVTARITLDPSSGRILAARRVDPTGTTTYAFDYAVRFPALAVPR